MRQEKHLQTFDLVLEIKSPVFIGCGKGYTRKEYLFDPRSHIVTILDEQKFFTFLVEHNLADAYEDYLLRNTCRNLREFLLNVCGVSKKEIDLWTRYRVDAAEALHERRSLKDIRRFIRNGNDQIYIPGSSIKGALRTAMLKEMLLRNPVQDPDPTLPNKRHYDFEDAYFNTLTLAKNSSQIVLKEKPVNSIMQGIRVSDSLPIPDSQLCLTRKIDELPDDNYNEINVCRECIKPGTTVYCTLTLDQSILRDTITIDSIQNAIAVASEYYQKTVTDLYPQALSYMNSRTILLGGGIGFPSKTVVDPYYGDQTLEITSKILNRRFPAHAHWKDVALGRSPRVLKQTDYNQTAYPYGVCEVMIR